MPDSLWKSAAMKSRLSWVYQQRLSFAGVAVSVQKQVCEETARNLQRLWQLSQVCAQPLQQYALRHAAAAKTYCPWNFQCPANVSRPSMQPVACSNTDGNSQIYCKSIDGCSCAIKRASLWHLCNMCVQRYDRTKKQFPKRSTLYSTAMLLL